MFEQLPPLKALRAFESAARQQSFTAAAKELFVTQGAISYQIKQLEEKLNIALLKRGVRQIKLTQAGERLFRVVHRQFRELEDEVVSISPDRFQTVLTVAVSTFFATRWLTRRLGDFLYKHPEVALRLKHSVNDPGFEISEVDVAIRWGKGDWKNTESELLFASPMIALCSSSLNNGEQPVRQLKDLKKQVFLHDQAGNDGWKEWLVKAGLSELGAGAGPVIVDPNVRVQSAIDGYGFVLANQLLEEDIKNNKLVEPFDIQLEGFGFHLLYTETIKQREAFTVFRQWLLDEVRVMHAASESGKDT